MKRVVIVGCCGAGKSTFAQNLAKKTALPLYHLDRIFWKPDWIEETPEIFKQKLNEWMKQDKWIIDGNYTKTAQKRFERADTVFFFDLPVWLCLYRILKRTIAHHGKSRTDMANGCHERFNWEFIRYVSKFKKETRPKILKTLEENAKHCQIVTFNTPEQVKEWLEN